jgi:hypothetical protein
LQFQIYRTIMKPEVEIERSIFKIPTTIERETMRNAYRLSLFSLIALTQIGISSAAVAGQYSGLVGTVGQNGVATNTPQDASQCTEFVFSLQGITPTEAPGGFGISRQNIGYKELVTLLLIAKTTGARVTVVTSGLVNQPCLLAEIQSVSFP